MDALRWWLRVVVAIALCVLGFAAVTTYGLVRTLQRAHTAALDDHGEDLRDSEALGIAIFRRSSSIRGYLLSGERHFLAEAEYARAEIAGRLIELRSNSIGRPHTGVDALEELFVRYDRHAVRAIEARAISAAAAQATWESDALPLQQQIEARFAALLAGYHAGFDAARTQARAASDHALRLIVLLMVCVVAIILVLIIAYARVTRRLIARHKHEQEQTTFRLLEQVPVGIFVITPDGKPYYLNQSAKKILGGEQPAVSDSLSVAYRAFEAGTERPYPRERAPLFRAVLGESTEVTDMEIRRADDEVIPVHMTAAPVYDAAGELLYAVAGFQDVRELQRVAMRDALTGLVNRAALTQTFVRDRIAAQRRRRPLAVALIDLDRFKAINDTHGHASGDEVLRRTAQMLVESFRRTDVVGRWGGEELVVFLPDTELDGARVALEKALAAVSALRFVGKNGEPFSVTFSAGAVVVTGDETLTDVIARADKLLYAAKAAGRACVHVAAAA